MKKYLLFVFFLSFFCIGKTFALEDGDTFEDTVYDKIIYVNGEFFGEQEVSQEEYENASIDSNNGRATIVETNYKKITLSGVYRNNKYEVILTNQWKNMPARRSFDVFAIRFTGFSVVDSTISGLQSYGTNGNISNITYSTNGTNIKKRSDGFGISMNLVDDPYINVLSNRLFFTLIPKSGYSTGELYGTYQHAVNTVTLAQSKNYTLSYSGLGRVLVYPSSIADNYDNMPGVNAIINF